MLSDDILGPYRIVGKLGEGGMGEVYRATDTNLKRQVAIKVLPPSVAADADRLARFQREAEVLASLSHPNIAAIYGLERAAGQTALVMELVEGPTLAARIAQGPLSIDDAVAIAKQIADALDAAHEQGIVHRDLKPANIKVKPDGGVKVLDFGLAKAIEPATAFRASAWQGSGGVPGPSMSPTITTPAMTRAGVILGSAAYMSPEQARGQRVDKRTDIWAFGCVLYEMLAGRSAFAADDVVATLAAVVKDQPDWTALPAETPAPLGRLLRGLLEKDPPRRLRDMGDVRLELDALDSPRALSSPVRAGSKAWRSVGAGLAGLLAGAIAVWMAAPRRAGTVPAPVLRVSVRLPPDQRIVTTGVAFVQIAISPDGTRLVYHANRRLYLRSLDSAESTALPNTEEGDAPFFSADGQSIGFEQNGKLVKLGLAGGTPVLLADVGTFAGARWGADNAIVFADAARGVFRVDSAGGTPVRLAAPDRGELLALPEVLPGGEWLLYSAANATLTEFRTIAQSLKTGQRRVLVKDGGSRYLATGHLLLIRRTGLSFAPFDAARAELTGPALAVPMGIGDGLGDVSQNGHVVFTNVQPDARRTALWLTRDGKPTRLPLEPGPYRLPRLSPDATRLAVARSDPRDNKSDIWLYDVDGSSATRLTFDGQSTGPVWTSDGRRLAFSGHGPQLFVRDADGTGRPRPLGASGLIRYPYLWFDGNAKLMFTELHETALDIGVVDTADGGKERLLLSSPASETRPDVSPDGHWLAYTSNESGRDEIYVRPLADVEAGKWQVSTGGGHSPLWLAGGRELVFRAPGHVLSVVIRPGATFRFDAPRPLFDDAYVNDTGGRSYDVSRDGRFLMLKDEAESTDEIHIVFNWFEELKRIVRTKTAG